MIIANFNDPYRRYAAPVCSPIFKTRSRIVIRPQYEPVAAMQGNREASDSVSLKGMRLSSHQFSDIMSRHNICKSALKLLGAYGAQLSCRMFGIAAKLLQFIVIKSDFHWLSIQFPFTYPVNKFYYSVNGKPIPTNETGLVGLEFRTA